MKFTEKSKSKRHVKFSDVKQGQIFFWLGDTYIATEEIISNMEDVSVNAICLNGTNSGISFWFGEDEEVSILSFTPEVFYTAEEIISWI